MNDRKKIAIIMSGIFRTDLKETIQNIYDLRSNFKDYDVRTYFVTWTIDDEIANEIKKHVDFFYMCDEPDFEWCEKNVPLLRAEVGKKEQNRRAAGSSISAYYMFKCRKIALNFVTWNMFDFSDKKFIPEFSLLIRNDAYLRITDLEDWFNNYFNTTTYMHQRKTSNQTFPMQQDQASDQFLFAKHKLIEKAFNLDDEYIMDLIKSSHNIEAGVKTAIDETRSIIKRRKFDFNDFYLLEPIRGLKGTSHVWRTK